MKKAIKVELIVDQGQNSGAMLNEAVCQYLEKQGFKVARPHVYPEDPIIIEIAGEIPEAQI